MTQAILRGLAAASGIAVGAVHVVRELGTEIAVATPGGGAAEQKRALDALATVSDTLSRWAHLARKDGRPEDADILDANRLIVTDPTLRHDVLALASDLPAEAAVLRATQRHAETLAGLGDPELAARETDVRELGQRAARLLAGTAVLVVPEEPAIVFARDLGPADVAELQVAGGRALGLALAEGAVTSHVAIMARSLGLPLVVGLGDELLGATDTGAVVLDGDEGVVIFAPSTAVRQKAVMSARRRQRENARLAARRHLQPVTTDGRSIRLLCNASNSHEIRTGLAAGADGVGLLRTELAFLESTSWPSEAAHAAALRPCFALLQGRTAIVRTLDFGEDKTPPFLSGAVERGLALALGHQSALVDQLRAILTTAGDARLHIAFPFVRHPTELVAARQLVRRAMREVGWTRAVPPIGAMIETPDAVEVAGEIAAEVDFLSIGTNDLVQYTLELDRRLPIASADSAGHPTVLGLVARVAAAAREREISVEVCGEAAGVPALAALFVGLGIDELSAAPAHLDRVRSAIRSISAERAATAAQASLSAPSLAATIALGTALLASGETGDEPAELRDGLGGVVT